MVFRAEGHTFKTRVLGRDHRRARILSTGTTDRATAQDVERFHKSLKARRQWEWLDLILDGKVKLPIAYDAYVRGELDAVMAAALAEQKEPNLDALLTTWAERGAEPVYVRMVRSLIVKGQRFPLSAFRRKAISDHLAGLKVGVITKRKYRVAFSMFGRWLIEQELLDTNPARDVALGQAPRRTLTFLDEAQMTALVPTLSGEQRALEALMAGSGIEWQAALRMRRRDIDPDKRIVHAYGSKNVHRDRWIEVTEDWAWSLFWNHAKTLTPNAQVFASTRETAALERHQRACALLKMPKTTLHQYRHAFAVMWIRRGATGDLRPDGRNTQWLKNQLGHAPESTMLSRIYGVYIRSARLSTQQEARLALTDSATNARASRKARGAK